MALGPLKNGTLEEQWTEAAPPPGGSDLVGKLQGGGVAKLDVPIEAGEMLWWGGEYGKEIEWAEEFEAVMDDAIANTMELMGEGFEHPSPIERGPSIHWEVFSEAKVFGAGQTSEGNAGNGSRGAAGDGASESAHDDSGNGAGTSLEMPSWTTKTVSSNKRTVDPSESNALALIEERRSAAPELPDSPAAYRSCEMGEKKSIHFLEAGQPLRRYAVKNVSEWGIQNLERAVKKSPGRQASEKEDLKALQWWDKAKSAGVDLPDGPKVWHYHPVTALKAIASRKPRFFIEIDGERHFVDRYEEMRDVIFEANEISASTIFGVPEEINNNNKPDREDAKSLLNDTTVKCLRPDGGTEELASGVTVIDEGWTGVATRGSGPSLYEMLIDPASETGIPEMADIHKNVWAALSPVEGNLNAVNAYDEAFLSFGPLQQTLGEGGDEGELQGALEATRLRCPDRYDEYFGQHDLFPTDVGPSAGVQKGHLTLHGERIDGSSGKSKLQSFRWIRRFKQAIDDSDFREAFLRYGFERLSSILQHSVPFEYEVKEQNGETKSTTTKEPTWQIGNIFRSDLGRALLLDTHINGPFYVWNSSVNIWRDKAETRFEEWGTKSLPITESQERQLILDLFDQRNRSGMYQPPVRSAKVLYYAELETIHDLVIDAGYSDARRPKNVTDKERNDFLDEKVGLDREKIDGDEINGMDKFSSPALMKRRVKSGNQSHDKILSFERKDLLRLQDEESNAG
jgi:hypothetical protein